MVVPFVNSLCKEIQIFWFCETDKAYCVAGYLKISYCFAEMGMVCSLVNKIPVCFPESVEVCTDGLFFKASYCHVDSDMVMWEGVLLPTKLSENCCKA